MNENRSYQDRDKTKGQFTPEQRAEQFSVYDAQL